MATLNSQKSSLRMGKLTRLPCRGNLTRRGLEDIASRVLGIPPRILHRLKFIHKKIIQLNDDGGLLTISGRQVVALKGTALL